uniref:Vitellogenin domain-containing protein n=2 Tax=Amphimedon queenslandica TaxID=400682 RepID=A0A1X7USR3_AMPQE
MSRLLDRTESCLYEYTAAAKITGGRQIDVSAHVEVFCESVGRFGDEIYTHPSQRSNWEIQERKIEMNDVLSFAGSTLRLDQDDTVYFHQEDKVEVDDEKRIQFSIGKTIIEFGSDKLQEATIDIMENGDDKKGIPALGASTDYKLKISHCLQEANADEADILSNVLYGHDFITDGLLSSSNKVKEAKDAMMELNSILPSFEMTLKQVKLESDSQKTMKLIDTWRKLLELESKYGALPGTSAKLPQLLDRLNEIKTDASSYEERSLICHLLSYEGSLESQQALLGVLKSTPTTSKEIDSVLNDIVMLTSVDPSTVDSLFNYYESLKPDQTSTDQLLLSIATLGRHENVEENIVSYLSVKLMSSRKVEDTSLILQALGNTASKKIVPLVLPFVSDPDFQSDSIDALRGVSMDERVEREFADIIAQSLHKPQLVIEIVESLLFPFKDSLYSPQLKKDLLVCEGLKTSLVQAGIKIHSDGVTSLLNKYFVSIKDEASIQELREGLQLVEALQGRKKRSSTSNWDSNADSKYDLIESHSVRTKDVNTYPYHKGYLWAIQIGYSKIHADIAAGGFGGIGIPGIKLYARARFDLVVWSRRYTALDIIFSYLREVPDDQSVSTLEYRRYMKVVGYTLLNDHHKETKEYKYKREFQKKLLVFKAGYKFFIYVGYLSLDIAGEIVGTATYEAYIARMDNDKNLKALAHVITGPTLTVKGEASATILEVFKVGLDVPASIIYTITPEASTSLCEEKPKGDANACFEVFSTTRGTIGVEAWWQRRTISCKWKWGPKCSIHWKDRNNFGPLSHTWNLVTLKKRLFGICNICTCTGSNFFTKLCKRGFTGAAKCSCKIQYSFGK